MDLKKFCIHQNADLRSAIEKMDTAGFGILLLENDERHIIGVITDGDVRRGLIKGAQLQDPAINVANTEFFFESEGKSYGKYMEILKVTNKRHLPVLNSKRQLVDLVILENYSRLNKENEIIVMAGGLGTRLGELTKDFPKPMLPIKGKPILEHIVKKFSSNGFKKFTFCLNFKGEVIEDHFEDGKSLGVDINYTKEQKRLGTAGALSLLKPRPTKPFMVINGDVLSTFDSDSFFDFHSEHNADLTVAAASYELRVPYGVLELDDEKVVGLQEKPSQTFYTNAGVYILNPECIDFVPENEFYDMTSLIKTLIDNNKNVKAFAIHEDWSDIGRPQDYDRHK